MDKKVTIDFSPRSVFVVVLSLLAIWLIFVLRDILVLFFVAFMFATIVEPMVDKLNSKKVPRILSILLVYILVAAILFALFRIVIPPIVEQSQELLNNREYISQGLEDVLNTAPGGVSEYINDAIEQLPDKITNYSSASLVDNVLGVFSGLAGGLTILVVSPFGKRCNRKEHCFILAGKITRQGWKNI
jgi:predicted PurR-regulated permease PerM